MKILSFLVFTFLFSISNVNTKNDRIFIIYLFLVFTFLFSISITAQNKIWSTYNFNFVKKTEDIALQGEREIELSFKLQSLDEMEFSINLLTEIEEGELLEVHNLMINQQLFPASPTEQGQRLEVREIREYYNAYSNYYNNQVDNDSPTSTTHHNGGISTRVNSDGSTLTTHHNGNISTQVNSDGSTSTIHHNGNISTQVNSDGSTSTNHHNGNISTQAHSNGSASTTYHNGNISTQVNSDGSTSTTHHNGNISTQAHSNGSASTTYHNGTYQQNNTRVYSPQSARPQNYITKKIERHYNFINFKIGKKESHELMNSKNLTINLLFSNQKLLIKLTKADSRKLKKKLKRLLSKNDK